MSALSLLIEMKRVKYLYIAWMAVLLLTACTEADETADGQGHVPVTLTQTMLTRAAQNLNEANLATGENVAVRITNLGATTLYTYQADGSGGLDDISAVKAYYPTDGSTVDITACYPATAGAEFSVAANQTTDDAYLQSDLLFASVTGQESQLTAVSLTFNHKMAKLLANVTAGDGVSSITSIEVQNVKRSVSFNQTTGAVALKGTASTITMSNNGAAVLPAQTIDGDLLVIHTSVGDATYSVSNKLFEAGRAYTFTLTVKKEAIGTTTAITDWVETGFDGSNMTRVNDLFIDPIPDQHYNSGYVKPTVTVRDGRGNIVDASNYDVYYVNNGWHMGDDAIASVVGKRGTIYENKAATRRFSIIKGIGGEWTIAQGSKSVSPTSTTFKLVVTHKYDGQLKAVSNNTSKVTVDIKYSTSNKNDTVVVNTLTSTGTFTLTLSIEEGQYYAFYDAPKTYTVLVQNNTTLSALKTRSVNGYNCEPYLYYQVAAGGGVAKTQASPIGFIADYRTDGVDESIPNSHFLVMSMEGNNCKWGSSTKAHTLAESDTRNGYSDTQLLQALGSTEATAAYIAWNKSTAIPSGGATPAHWFLPNYGQFKSIMYTMKQTGTQLLPFSNRVMWTTAESSAGNVRCFRNYDEDILSRLNSVYPKNVSFPYVHACFAY